jgi:iron complex outermembrane recepter protein
MRSVVGWVLIFQLLGLFWVVELDGSEGEGVVTGTVRAEDGRRLAGAQVVVVGSGRATLTDGSGRFRVAGLAAGTHRLQASALGYAPASAEVQVGASGSPATVDFLLVATPLALPGIQVTGTPAGRETLFAMQSTTQLRGRALERSLGGSIAQTLGEQPGIGVRYNGPGAAAPVVRGLTGDRVLLLQDGQRTADLSGSADDHGVAIDPLAAQRIEVVRGPAALLYGNNALGGVVNVITGDDAVRVPARAEWAGALQSESVSPGGGGMVRVVVPLGERWLMTVRGSARSAGDVRIGRDPQLGGHLENTDRWTREASAGFGYAADRLTVSGNLRGHAFGYGLPMPAGADEEIRLSGRLVAAVGRAELALGSGPFSMLRASGTVQDYFHEEADDGHVEMAFGLRTRTGELLLRQAPAGRLAEGAWGVSGLFRRYVATGEEQLTAPADARTFGIFTYQELPIVAGGPSFQLGARLDRYAVASQDDPSFGPGTDRSFTAFSGSTGLNVPLTPGASVAFSVARSFRAPTVEEMFSNALHAGTASFEVGDPGLDPEYALGFDGVFRVQTPGWHAEASAYHNRVSNFVHFVERGDTVIDGTPWPILGYTQSEARLTGVEGFVERSLGRRLVASVRGDHLRAEHVDGTPLPFVPASRLAGALRWEGPVVSAGGSLRHTFAREVPGLEGDEPTDAYTLFGLDGGVRLQRGGSTHSVVLRVENLTDRLYRDAASRIKEFAPNPGRNVALLYRVSF